MKHLAFFRCGSADCERYIWNYR